MPLWGTRLIAGSSASQRNALAAPQENVDRRGQRHGTRTDPSRASSRAGEPVVQPLRPGPESSPSKTSSSSSAYRPKSGHGRSLSNPFPALFGSTRRSDRSMPSSKNVVDAALTDDDDDDNADAEPEWDAIGVDMEPWRPGHHRESGAGGDKDHRTGRCMTCGSVMRWPRTASSFRCTECSTVNDLAPRPYPPGRTGQLEDTSNGVRPGIVPRPPVLSLERTQAIVDRCIKRYLEARLRRGSAVQRAPAERGVDEQHVGYAPREACNASRGPSLDEPRRLGLPIPSPRLGPPSPRFQASSAGSSGGNAVTTAWEVPRPRGSSGPTIYSQSSPEHFSSHLEHVMSQTPDTPYPAPPARKPPPPPPPPPPVVRTPSHRRDPTQPQGERSPRPAPVAVHPPARSQPQRSPQAFASIFRPLEEYIVSCFGSWEAINSSFLLGRPMIAGRSASEDMGKPRRSVGGQGGGGGGRARDADGDGAGAGGGGGGGGGVGAGAGAGAGAAVPALRPRIDHVLPPLPVIDAKTLLLGDFAENGSWWAGHRSDGRSPSLPLDGGGHGPLVHAQEWALAGNKTPRVDWPKLVAWYQLVLKAGASWKARWDDMVAARPDPPGSPRMRPADVPDQLREMEDEMEHARVRLQRTLLHAIENLLKRPGRPLRTPDDLRVLMILMANPLLHSLGSSVNASRPAAHRPTTSGADHLVSGREHRSSSSGSSNPANPDSRLALLYPAIVKRLLGLLANLDGECHHVLVSWFSRLSDSGFRRTVDLVGGFVTYRLSRGHTRQRSDRFDPTAGLVPQFDALGLPSSARLHAALGPVSSSADTSDHKRRYTSYSRDWQMRAAARVMALLFAANGNQHHHHGGGGKGRRPSSPGRVSSKDTTTTSSSSSSSSTPLSLEHFYNHELDSVDLMADFDVWEGRRGGFAFCQYPFFLSLAAKTQILQRDARRQQGRKARDAFFDSLFQQTVVEQQLLLRVRRDCLIEDSLRAVSEVVGAGGDDIKKELRIDFVGEEGVDAGGLRKEWFLLLVRDVFDPSYGLFSYDDDSHYCYFNPSCLETSDQFFLVGVLLGLAIYNLTILDVALPPFAFKRLLASAPAPALTSTSSPGLLPSTAAMTRIPQSLTLDDLAEYRPALAHGLRQLLQYDGDDVEEVFCLDFVVPVERYGQVVHVPLRPDGEHVPVTKANRREYVDLYVQFLLDGSVARQFDPFRRGFYTVCGGSSSGGNNALSLFRPEEIDLLVRGSGRDEPLDISTLRAVAVYENWPSSSSLSTCPPDRSGSSGSDESDRSGGGSGEPVIAWFWAFLERLAPRDQRKLLGFVTGSDRVPALGAAHLVIRLVCAGDDCDRFPFARTCFNSLCLWRYGAQDKLEEKLWRAVVDSEGFGLR